MGGSSSKDDLISKLDDLDKEEIEINKELRELQIRLNELVPPEERIDVKEHYFDETISKRKKMGEPDYNIPINGKLITDKIKINKRTRIKKKKELEENDVEEIEDDSEEDRNYRRTKQEKIIDEDSYDHSDNFNRNEESDGSYNK
jgi:hypothetical protein